MLKKQLLSLFLILYLQNSVCFIENIWTAVQGVWILTDIASEHINTITDRAVVYDLFTNGSSDKRVVNHFHEMQQVLHRIEHDKGFKIDIIRKMVIGLPKDYLLERDHREILTFITRMDEKYNSFLEYLNSHDTITAMLDDFTYIFILRYEKDVEDVRKLIMPPGEAFLNIGPVSSRVKGVTNYTDLTCDLNQTLQQRFINYYTIIMEEEVKIFTILAFSYMYQHLKEDGHYMVWPNKLMEMRNEMQEVFVNYTRALSNSLKLIDSSYLRTCNPKDSLSYELDGLLQNVIFKYDPGTFSRETCDEIWNNKWYNARWLDDRTKCNGQVLSCDWLGDVETCALKKGPHKYKWVQSSQKGLMGKGKNVCPSLDGYKIQLSSSAWMSGCMCSCQENKWGIYLGSLTSSESDNYVITGIRFVQKNNVLFLQPAHGKLEADGKISNYSWVELPKTIDESDIGKVDLTYYSFFFDNLRLPAGYALTEVKFIPSERGRGSKIAGYSIEISGVPFDYYTGTLDLKVAHKLSASVRTLSAQTPLEYERLNPSYVANHTLDRVSPKQYTFVSLGQSKLDDDFGQSMLPLFDGVPLVTSPPSPLGGLGIFHKGAPNHAGYISLRLYPINYSFYVDGFLKLYDADAAKASKVQRQAENMILSNI